MQGNGIHVALHQNKIAKLAFFRQVQGKEVFSLVENQGFRGVQVLGSILIGVIHDSTAEADDISPDIDDGEHQPIPEPVEKVPVLLGNRYQP